MTPEQAASHRQQLQEMRTALLGQMQSPHGELPGGPQDAEDHSERGEDSAAQLASERELASALDGRELGELAMIDAALARIRAGTYGHCIDCGTDIAPQRLQVSPEAPRCIGCQEKAEQSDAA